MVHLRANLLVALEKEMSLQVPTASADIKSPQRGQLGSLEDPKHQGLWGWEEVQPESCREELLLCSTYLSYVPSPAPLALAGEQATNHESGIVQRASRGQTSCYHLSLAISSTTASYSWPGSPSSSFVCFLLAADCCRYQGKCQRCLSVYST